MKKNWILRFIPAFIGVGILLTISSCKKDEDPKPIADFSYEPNSSDIKAIDFTNESTNASTYLWEFGEGSTSTEESPSHSYADFGTYTVTLTATGAGGSDEISYDIVIEDPGIVIDGDFEDWTDIAAVASYPDGEGRTLLELKVDDNETFLFFYVKGTSNLGEVIQIFIDSDNDGATGWDYWSFYETPGIEYMLEAVFVGWDGTDPSSVIQTATGADVNWPWEPFITANAVYGQSEYVTSGDNTLIEFSVLKEMFSNPALGNTIRLVVGNSDNTWSNVGHLPPSAMDPLLAPITYEMN